MIPTDLLYTDQHEWVRVEGDTATVGITDHAQKALGDITFVELPADGQKLADSEEACVVESCKAAASVYAPGDGEVAEVNETLEDEPEKINADPYGDGWIYKITLKNVGAVKSSLMNAAAYEKFLEEQGD